MPIIFAQPSGFGAGSDALLSAVNQWQERGQRDQQMAMQYAMHQDSLAMQGAHLAEQRRQFNASREVSPRDSWEAQARVQSALAINQGQLSQAENMRLQRLQSSLSQVDDALSRNQITPEEAQEMRYHIQGIMSPLQVRHAQAQVQMQNQQIQHMQMMNQIQQVALNQNDQVRANGLGSLVQPFYNDTLRAPMEAEVRQDLGPDATPQMIQAETHRRLRDTPGGILAYGIPRLTPQGTHVEWVAPGDLGIGGVSGGHTRGQGGQGSQSSGSQSGSRTGGGQTQLSPQSEQHLFDSATRMAGTAPVAPAANATPERMQTWQQEMDRYHNLIGEHYTRLRNSAMGVRSGTRQNQAPNVPQQLQNAIASIDELDIPDQARGQLRSLGQQALQAMNRHYVRPEDRAVVNYFLNQYERMPRQNRQNQGAAPSRPQQQSQGQVASADQGRGALGDWFHWFTFGH